jgi:hypothetical protein
MRTPRGYAPCCAAAEIGLDNKPIGGNFLRRPSRNYPALRENEHVIGERRNRLHHVFRHQDCYAAGGKLPDDRHHVANF